MKTQALILMAIITEDLFEKKRPWPISFPFKCFNLLRTIKVKDFSALWSARGEIFHGG